MQRWRCGTSLTIGLRCCLSAALWVNPDGSHASTILAYSASDNALVLTGDVSAYNRAHADSPVSEVVSDIAWENLKPPICANCGRSTVGAVLREKLTTPPALQRNATKMHGGSRRDSGYACGGNEARTTSETMAMMMTDFEPVSLPCSLLYHPYSLSPLPCSCSRSCCACHPSIQARFISFIPRKDNRRSLLDDYSHLIYWFSSTLSFQLVVHSVFFFLVRANLPSTVHTALTLTLTWAGLPLIGARRVTFRFLPSDDGLLTSPSPPTLRMITYCIVS